MTRMGNMFLWMAIGYIFAEITLSGLPFETIDYWILGVMLVASATSFGMGYLRKKNRTKET